MALHTPLMAFDTIIGQRVDDDKVMHFLWGSSMYGVFQGWGWSESSSLRTVLIAATAKELYDSSTGGDVDGLDVLATMLGAFSVQVCDGVYFRFLYTK